MQYEAMIGAGELPVIKGVAVDDDDALRAAAIQSLMCFDKLDYGQFDAQHEIDFKRYFAGELARLEPLVADGLVTVSDRAIQITPRGRLLLRSIAMVFDRYIGDERHGQRYSKAI